MEVQGATELALCLQRIFGGYLVFHKSCNCTKVLHVGLIINWEKENVIIDGCGAHPVDNWRKNRQGPRLDLSTTPLSAWGMPDPVFDPSMLDRLVGSSPCEAMTLDQVADEIALFLIV